MKTAMAAIFFTTCVLIFVAQSSETLVICPPHEDTSTSSIYNDAPYDTPNLRFNADFNIEVADGVFWVPVNCLGKTKYSNKQIAAMVSQSPEQKQASIRTLFEAVQLYQISKFKGIYDNIKISEQGIEWEHHKPGYDSVRTNEGCCASDAAWLTYILKNDYDEIGTCGFGQHDGNGHIINYIKHDGWYYFIDMMQYRLDSLPTSGTETGQIKDYLKAYEAAGGNFHRSKHIENYVDYLKKSLKHTPCFFITCKKDYCPPIGSRSANGITYFIYPDDDNIEIHYIDTLKTKVGVEFMKRPQKSSDWSNLPDARIIPVDLPFVTGY